MAIQTRAIKRRIRSVKNTRKITKAMELVAASKMRRAMEAAVSARPFSEAIRETVSTTLPSLREAAFPLVTTSKEVRRVLLFVFAADRGLAGGYNVNLTKLALEIAKQEKAKAEVEAICVGKKAAEAMQRAGIPILASFTDLPTPPTFASIRPAIRLVREQFLGGLAQKVLLISTEYRGVTSQKAVMTPLLPLQDPRLHPKLPTTHTQTPTTPPTEYLFEPERERVFERLLPRLMDALVHQASLESAASEHASRMLAMRSASDAAGDMIDSLTFTFNQARQAGITQEIAEISGGKAALETSL